MPFAEILGQAEPLRQLSRAIESGRLAHAYLFEGPNGVGKSMAARALARMLLCPQKGACSNCPDCELIKQDKHPLVRTYTLPRASRNIGVDVIRDDLIPFFSLKSAPGEYKIAIIDPADALSEEAANMLLKTLEEPGRWSLLMLLTATAEALLPTIRSRALRIRFGRIPKRLIMDRLVEKMHLSGEHAQVVANLACGSMGRAQELAGKDFVASRIKALDTFAELVAGKADPLSAARTLLEIASPSVRSMQEKRADVQQMLDLLLTYVRDLAVTGEKCEVPPLHGDRETLSQEAGTVQAGQAFEIFEKILETKKDIESNVNVQLTVEEFCLEVSEAGQEVKSSR